MRNHYSRRLFYCSVCCALTCALLLLLCTPFTTPATAGLRLGSRENIEYVNSLNSNSNKSFQYGLDPGGIPFAKKDDGSKARFIDLSPNLIKIQITDRLDLGEVEIERLPQQTAIVRFKARTGGTLIVQTSPGPGGDDGSSVEFQYKKEKSI